MVLILVTGASSGLGYTTATALAEEGHDVVVHARTPARVTAPAGGGRWAGVVTGDLAETGEVPGLVRQTAAFGRFDTVIHNAGTMHTPEAATVNVIAPYLLTALMDKPSRLIYLSSSMHRGGSTSLARLADGTASYSDSKLWVTTLAMAVADRWEKTAAQAVDPGWVPTRMGGPGATDDLAAGHQTQVWLATHDDITPPTGGYWYHQRTQDPHPAAREPKFQDLLLHALEERTGVRLD
ncbi:MULTISPECIES: SDR family NAD(P)-dependent oxidoreductase [Streptomyces]|uniref:SDR family NAD(P)-dependent oxidoreductase n=1 Tax=Streptomyces mirabilis TaxID=68239 RepID=A0ABU3UH43_9ACTN|nr:MULTISPECIES: SDR family NAD(P)-dependent oxidoreductase [Streptomyces]MCX4613051.1 SDR family NAD(P)-dependent oxidoreductase [Streptomyces mirabilis]MCX5353182.1 SDR family NAD(P)-dependent oxidoreductase [Streptomyces mirabilis]MDU8993243.1 SDR family NAD(P)-dependent oxidoreductase [Streptomyces mirabilis]QDN91208.1 SDR family NAD(P)-dependent oxidoreductase [Streptomyces sp. RLB3-6]QDO12033.1 SDR family NAD(P)-dependent oxidoreductase [Streptomyces sp. S1D4-23]